MTGSTADDRRLPGEITGALLWVAAFAFACGVFFSVTLLLRNFPPTPPVATGIVTIQHVSKLHDYVTAALFFLLVPPLTVWLRRIGARVEAWHRRAVAPQHRTVASILFSVPYLLSPAFYLTTGKVGWVLLLPLVLSNGVPQALAFADHRLWLRRLLRRDLRPFHALIAAGGFSWILFRYLVTWKRIAHFPTLFLELVFLVLFVSIFVAIAVYIAMLASLLLGVELEDVIRRIAVGAAALVALPVIAIALVPTPHPARIVILALLAAALIASRVRDPNDRAVWKLAGWIVMPVLIYCFVLHGMMEDGQLDAWLMQMFGRSVDVSVAESVVLGGCLALSLWYLGIVLFDSIPLALLVVALGAWTTAENSRTFFQVAAVAFFWHGLKRDRRLSLFAAGVLAAIALFFSYDIGIYTIAGGLLAIALLAIAARRDGAPQLPLRGALLFFVIGILAGSAPFIAFLAARGAAGDFFQISFVTLPRIIDAVWSLPFPDLVSTFRTDLNLPPSILRRVSPRPDVRAARVDSRFPPARDLAGGKRRACVRGWRDRRRDPRTGDSLLGARPDQRPHR